MIYTDQFTPADLDGDYSLDNLHYGDIGVLIEHLSPFGHHNWTFATSALAMKVRIYEVKCALVFASLNDI